MIPIGITGGLGSGKSTAAEFFKEKGNEVFDADVEAKAYISKSISIQGKIIKTFGNIVTTQNGKLDLRKLGKVAFQSSFDQQLLNGIVWPELYIVLEDKLNSISSQKGFFFVDAALIFESKFNSLFKEVLLIKSSKRNRIERALMRKTLTEKQIQERIKLQYTDKQKSALASHVISNNGSIESFTKSLDKYYQSIKKKFSI